MADSPPPVLSATETKTAERLLTRVWGGKTEVQVAEPIWDRSNVVRLRVEAGRSVVLKRRGAGEHNRQWLAFGIELASLEYLTAMPVPVAPRLLSADPQSGLLLMEDLGPGASLADSLLTGNHEDAQAGLIAYAQALASMHAWSLRHPGELASLRAHYAPQAPAGPQWLDRLEPGKQSILALAATLGLPVDGVADELTGLGPMLTEAGYVGLVHGDACPDNLRLIGDQCRIFDFETSGWGPIVLDAAYLLAPFPSCWCFADLPREVATPALDAYRACLQAAGLAAGADLDAAMTAALACWIVVRSPRIPELFEEDPEWGTTTLRPRIMTWLRTFIAQAEATGTLPRLHALATALHDDFSRRWPGLTTPDYPALARPGSAPVLIPEWWRPRQ
jgi:Ser/Thr protein kinase RdoA (MazF antagonist)